VRCEKRADVSGQMIHRNHNLQHQISNATIDLSKRHYCRAHIWCNYR
jgi:hypothetical protein